MMTTSTPFGSLSPARRAEVDALRARATQLPKVREALLKEAHEAALLIAHNGFPAATPEAAQRAREAFCASWKWQAGDIVLVDQNGQRLRPYRGRGRSPSERRAWAYAVQAWALSLLNQSPEAFVLDRVEHSARGIAGKRQGSRLNEAEVEQLGAKDAELVSIRVQKLVKYRPNVHRVDMNRVLAAFEAGEFEEPEVNLSPVDDGGEGEAVGRSRWSHVFVDGAPYGAPTVTWLENAGSFDDEVDPTGWLRAKDERAGVPWVGQAEFAERFERLESDEQKRVSASMQKRAKRARERLDRELWAQAAQAKEAMEFTSRVRLGRLTPSESKAYVRYMHGVTRAQRAHEAEQTALAGSIKLPKHAQGLSPEVQQQLNEERALGVFLRSREPKPVTRKAVTPMPRTSEEREAVFAAAREADHAKCPAFLGSNAIGRSALDPQRLQRVTQLLADESEVQAKRFLDVPMRDVELVEESIRFFEQGVDPDADLSLDQAVANVPALSEHVERHQARRKKGRKTLPQGMIGAFAYAKRRYEDLQRFDRGLAQLEVALTA